MTLRKRVHPWRDVVDDEGTVTRNYGSTTRLTSGQALRQLRLTCGHLVERTANRPTPKKVRCEDCPEVGP